MIGQVDERRRIALPDLLVSGETWAVSRDENVILLSPAEDDGAPRGKARTVRRVDARARLSLGVEVVEPGEFVSAETWPDGSIALRRIGFVFLDRLEHLDSRVLEDVIQARLDDPEIPGLVIRW